MVSIDRSVGAGALTPQEIEARLIQAVRVFRDPRGGKRIASDGPWHLTRHEGLGGYWMERLGLAALGEPVDVPLRTPLPSGAQITLAEEAMGWLVLIPETAGGGAGRACYSPRRIVCDVIGQLAAGRARPDWRALCDPSRAAEPADRSREGMRYRAALEKLAKHLRRDWVRALPNDLGSILARF